MEKISYKTMNRGLTLIEIMIVVGIIAILVGLAIPNFRRMQISGNIAKAKGDTRVLQTALESYYAHYNLTYPSLLSNLTLATPRIVNTLPTDPFNSSNDYGYATSPNGDYYVVYSPGEDGDGSASVDDNGDITENNPDSCIYTSNAQEDLSP